ncbi:DUF4817 domain-containing protein [Trichonephila clavipes]|nr:DUF4817 domain-containing protein [Trichonephila clavipes]
MTSYTFRKSNTSKGSSGGQALKLFSISIHGVSRLESDRRGVADRCVTRQKRQLHSILPPTSFHRTIGGGDVSDSASGVDQAMDVLRTGHSAVSGVEWYAQTLNDALQTQCAVLRCQVIYSQFGLAIHQNDHQARRRFVEWDQNEIAVVPDFHKRILFSDEARFWLNGYVNKQNCRIWSEANPQVYVETPLHPEKLTVWCALWAGGILLQKR